MKGTKKEEPESRKNPKLSNEFKDEIIKERGNKKWPVVVLVSLFILVILTTLGLGAYQIFYENVSEVDTTPTVNKIESMPKETQKPADETKVPSKEPAQTKPAEISYTEYTVQEGDTWSSIANSHEMGSAALMSYNGASSEDLQIGQVVKIPKQ